MTALGKLRAERATRGGDYRPSTLGAARSGSGLLDDHQPGASHWRASLAKRRRSRPRTDAARDLSVGDTMAGPPEGSLLAPVTGAIPTPCRTQGLRWANRGR